MPIEDVIEQCAGRRLPAFVQPKPGDHRVEYGPHTPWMCRASGDTAMWHVEVPAIIARRELRSSRREAAEQSESARMRVDETDADHALLRETELGGRGRA